MWVCGLDLFEVSSRFPFNQEAMEASRRASDCFPLGEVPEVLAFSHGPHVQRHTGRF